MFTISLVLTTKNTVEDKAKNRENYTGQNKFVMWILASILLFLTNVTASVLIAFKELHMDLKVNLVLEFGLDAVIDYYFRFWRDAVLLRI